MILFQKIDHSIQLEARLAELDQVFQRAVGTFDSLLDAYDDGQLATIIDFLERASAYSCSVIASLQPECGEPRANDRCNGA